MPRRNRQSRRRGLLISLVGCILLVGVVVTSASQPAGAVPAVPPGQIETVAGGARAAHAATDVAIAPTGLARNGSHVIVADGSNSIIRDVDPVADTQTAFAGQEAYGVAGDGGP